jgi:hypothetical protein
MAAVTKVLDRSRVEARARLVDVLALGLLVATGAALVFDMYTIGYQAAQAGGGGGIVVRDASLVRLMIESFLAAVALCWIAFRLFAASARRAGA